MQISENISLDFQDVLIRPNRSTLKSRNDVSLVREFKFYHTKYVWKGIPIIAANMDTIGTFEMAEAFFKHKMLVAIHKHYSVEEWNSFSEKHQNTGLLNHVMISIGTSDANFKYLKDVMSATKNRIPFICIDIANGYSEHLITFLEKVRKEYPESVITAGNVVTGNMAEQLIISGADIVKVGIGGGSVCTTRLMTGVGRPQLSAIIDCGDAAHGLKGHIISDGGCKNPSDISKAFGGSADFVMLGGILSGHEECAGKTILNEETGKRFKEFYGMSSSRAMNKHSGGVAKYRASEGKAVLIPYRGTIEETIQKFLGGIRSTCTYIGAESIKEIPKRTTFERTSKQLNEVYGAADWYST
jgi:GMP reductase